MLWETSSANGLMLVPQKLRSDSSSVARPRHPQTEQASVGRGMPTSGQRAGETPGRRYMSLCQQFAWRFRSMQRLRGKTVSDKSANARYSYSSS